MTPASAVVTERQPAPPAEADTSPDTEGAAPLSASAPTVAWKVVAAWTFATIVLTPVIFSSWNHDSFRLPKVLLLRLAAIGAVAGIVAFATRADWDRIKRLGRLQLVLPIAFVIAAAISTALSPRPLIAQRTLVTLAAGAIFSIAAAYIARDRGFALLDALMIPAVVNAAVLVAQRYGGWNPFDVGIYDGAIALLGNPNDAGAYLLAPALAGVAVIVSAGPRRRLIYIPTTAVIIAGLLATHTVTAIAAFSIGLMALVITRWRARGVAAAVLAVALTVTGVALSPLSTRIASSEALYSWEGRNVLLSGRLNAFAAAWEMFRDRPLIGGGPGTYAPLYFEYRLRADIRHGDKTPYPPELGSPINFGEAHNDYLQVLAELGLLGLVLFLLALGGVAARSLHLPRSSSPRRVSSVMAAPLVVAVTLEALAGFPLQLATCAVTYLALAAFCLHAGDAADAQ